MVDATIARVQPRRSVLYVPASNARAIEKARGLGCDAVILDLEDAVAPGSKHLARDAALAAVATGGFEARELVIRINALGTMWGRADLNAVVHCRAAAVLVPKINVAADVLIYEQLLRSAPASMQLWAMIETARSVLEVAQIAAVSQNSRLRCLVVGTNDLAGQLGMRLTAQREPLAAMLGMTVAAARAYSLTALDGVYNAFNDSDGFDVQCRQGVDYGFDGKTLIHPRQIDRANQLFSPSPESIAWATKIKLAFDQLSHAGAGAIDVDGAMIERLHLMHAERILAIDAVIRDRSR
jgi:citrate lyase subunit beta / citryl-CoA lyase